MELYQFQIHNSTHVISQTTYIQSPRIIQYSFLQSKFRKFIMLRKESTSLKYFGDGKGRDSYII